MAIAVLFDKGRSTIAEHLRNIFQSQEMQEDSVCRKFRRTAADGKDYVVVPSRTGIKGYSLQTVDEDRPTLQDRVWPPRNSRRMEVGGMAWISEGWRAVTQRRNFSRRTASV